MKIFEDIIASYISKRELLFNNRLKNQMKMADFLTKNNELAISFEKDVCNVLNTSFDLSVMALYSAELQKWFKSNPDCCIPNNDDMRVIANNFCNSVYAVVYEGDNVKTNEAIKSLFLYT